MDIRDRVAIVTGATSGIGLATARLFAARGALVALVARSTDKLEQLEIELAGSYAVPTDLRDPLAVRTMVTKVKNHYSRVEVLINNAGQGLHVPIERVDLGQYRQIVELNVFGPLLAMQAVTPIMREQGGGVIVNVSSGLSKMYLPGVAAYASTKYALNALSLTARAELAADNISVGVIYPNMTDTNFAQNSFGAAVERHAGPHGPAGPPRSEWVPEVDTAEMVAEKILEAVQTERAEQYMSEAQERRLNGGN